MLFSRRRTAFLVVFMSVAIVSVGAASAGFGADAPADDVCFDDNCASMQKELTLTTATHHNAGQAGPGGDPVTDDVSFDDGLTLMQKKLRLMTSTNRDTEPALPGGAAITEDLLRNQSVALMELEHESNMVAAPAVPGATLFAVTTGSSCAETLPYGTQDVTTRTGAYIQTGGFASSTSHEKWIQRLQPTGATSSEDIEITYTFSSLKTLEDRFEYARTYGEPCSWEVKTADGSSYTMSGSYWYSNGMGSTSGKFNGGSGSSGFSADDGAWGAQNGEVQFNSPATSSGFWGHGNPNSGDSECSYLYRAGSRSSRPSLKNYMYLVKPADCQWSNWTAWSQCSQTCGGGTQTRNRSVAIQAETGGAACAGAASDMQACNDFFCPVDCVMGNWSQWSQCDEPCGPGVQTRERNVSVPASHGGRACSNPVEQRNCTIGPCPVDCVMSNWTDVGSCSASCGNGQQNQTRTIQVLHLHGGASCPTELTRLVTCSVQPCPVDCVLSSWIDDGTCTQTCGGGKIKQIKSVEVAPSNGGQACDPVQEQLVDCHTQSCSGGSSGPSSVSEPASVSEAAGASGVTVDVNVKVG